MPQFLKKLFTDWSLPRVYFWAHRILSPLFGRHIRCRTCGKSFGKIVPFAWGNRVALIGLQKEHARIVPCGVSELMFECVEHDRRSEEARRARLQPSPKLSNPTVLHAFLAHQSAPYVESYGNFHRQRLSAGDELLLVFGGEKADFESIGLERKTFCEDPRLRGTMFFQSYSEVLTAIIDWCKARGERWDYIYFTEGDHWSLSRDYAQIVPRLLQEHGAHFGARGLVDVEMSNNWFVANGREYDEFESRLSKVSTSTRPEFWHCLGTGMCFAWEALEDFCSLKHDETKCFLEVYIPSVIASRGWRGLNVNACGSVYDHVRYRPLYSDAEFLDALKSGVQFMHPYKPTTLEVIDRTIDASAKRSAKGGV